jgi:DNA-binding MarR family transcriptional regulator
MELIVRTADPADRRSALIRISPKGKRIADKAIEIVVEAEGRLFGSLVGSEHKALDRILDRLIAHVDSAATVETPLCC